MVNSEQKADCSRPIERENPLSLFHPNGILGVNLKRVARNSQLGGGLFLGLGEEPPALKNFAFFLQK